MKNNKQKKIRSLQIRLSPDDYNKLSELSLKLDRAMGALAREAIKYSLEEKLWTN